jgi:Mycothiol maleylpyruvate isomerase N-terminal domain
MYLDALEFLEEERDAFRPYEALNGLTDAQLCAAVADAHGWSGRDLMGHLTAWLEQALAVARELAMGERSASKERLDAEWAAGGDAVNDRLGALWEALPLDEVRERFRTVPGELRGTLTVVPETRWLKNADNMRYLLDETIDHYTDHAADLAAILAAAAR